MSPTEKITTATGDCHNSVCVLAIALVSLRIVTTIVMVVVMSRTWHDHLMSCLETTMHI